MTAVTAVYLLPVLYLLELLWVVGVVVFFGGYLGGAILHLVQDSCTIQWNFPFSEWKISGQLTTTARPEDVRYQRGFLTVIGVGVGGAFFVPMVVSQYPAWVFSVAGLFVVVLLWVGFASVVAI